MCALHKYHKKLFWHLKLQCFLYRKMCHCAKHWVLYYIHRICDTKLRVLNFHYGRLIQILLQPPQFRRAAFFSFMIITHLSQVRCGLVFKVHLTNFILNMCAHIITRGCCVGEIHFCCYHFLIVWEYFINSRRELRNKLHAYKETKRRLNVLHIISDVYNNPNKANA